MTFRLRGRSFTITPSDVLEVTRNVPPSQRDGRNKYFVTIHGHQYPIKQVLQLVSGLSRVGFTAQDAHRILSRLGFDIFEDQAPPPNGEITAGTTGGSTSRGVPAIGEATNQDDSDVRKLLVVFETDEDGWEVASCPTLPGCNSQGRTRHEALDNIREAIRGYLASLHEHDAPPPSSSEFQVVEVRV
jgi:predicted RNase H-like HicB family nuclease